MAGVIPVIFASSILFLPMLITQFNQPAPGEDANPWVVWIANNLVQGDQPLYMIVFFFLNIAFAFFYIHITFNPEEGCRQHEEVRRIYSRYSCRTSDF